MHGWRDAGGYGSQLAKRLAANQQMYGSSSASNSTSQSSESTQSGNDVSRSVNRQALLNELHQYEGFLEHCRRNNPSEVPSAERHIEAINYQLNKL